MERGFSTNKEIIIENQQLLCLVSRRIIKDAIQDVGGLQNVVINKEMLNYAASARHKYRDYLDMEQVKKRKNEVSKKRKDLGVSIESLQKKRKWLQKSICELNTEADKLSDEGDNQRNITLFQRAHACRKSVTEKEDLVIAIEREIEAKSSELGPLSK